MPEHTPDRRLRTIAWSAAMKVSIASLCLVALTACGGGSVAHMMDSIRKLDARPEHRAASVTIRRILIGFAGTTGGLKRTRAEAEKLAADLLARLQAGADFVALMREFSNDAAAKHGSTGTRTLTKETRGNVARSVGNVAWRLEVGETGVAPYDANACPSGWYLIQRVK